MANISGKLIFDTNRNGTEDGTDVGIANVPIFLQDTATNDKLPVSTTNDGSFEFTNVPDGTYQLIVASEFVGTPQTSPADFTTPEASQEQQESSLPDYQVVPEANRVAGMNGLNAVTPTTLNITIQTNQDVADQNFFIGPVIYEPLDVDSALTVLPTNLITDANNGDFGTLTQGTDVNGGPATSPYPNITTDYTFVQQSGTITEGNYTIGNTIQKPNMWQLSDSSTDMESGQMQILDGNNIDKHAFNTTVTVQPNTNYLLTSWAANLDNTAATQTGPQMVMLVEAPDGTEIANLTQDLTASSNTIPTWKQVGIMFNSGDNTSVTLKLSNATDDPNEPNIVALDDIYLQETTVPIFTAQTTVNPGTASVGDTVTYTNTLTNPANTALTNAIFTDAIPTELEFVPGSVTVNGTTQADANPATGVTIGTISPNGTADATATVTYEARVTAIPATPEINNPGEFTFDYTPTPVGDPLSIPVYAIEENPLYVSNAVIDGNSFTKTADTQTAVVGENIPYTITLQNTGNVEATNVTITDTIPAGTTYIADSLVVKNTQTGAEVNYTGNLETGIVLTDPLRPGADNEVTIEYSLNVTDEPTINPLTNTANLSYKYTKDPADPNGAQGMATATADVNITDDYPITVNKSVDPTQAAVGDTVTYTITLTNTSVAATYSNIKIVDQLSNYITFEPGSVTIDGIPFPNVNITAGVTLLDNLTNNTPITVTFRAIVNSAPQDGIIPNVSNVLYDVEEGTTTVQALAANSNQAELKVTQATSSVTVTVSHTPTGDLVVGDTITYTINVTNNGDTEITDASISTELPEQYFDVTQVTVDGTPINNLRSTAEPAPIDIATDSIPIGNLPPNSTKTVEITADVVGDGLTDYQNVVNFNGQAPSAVAPVQVTAQGEDPQPVNIVPQPQPSVIVQQNINLNRVSIAMYADKTVAYVGDTITYTIAVSNIGSVSVGTRNYPVTVYDNLSPSVSLIPESLMVNNMPAQYGRYGINLGILSPGQVRIITFTVRIRHRWPNPVYNQAKVVYGYDPLYIGESTYTVNGNILLTYLY